MDTLDRLRYIEEAAESLIDYIKNKPTAERPFIWKCPYMQKLDDAIGVKPDDQ